MTAAANERPNSRRPIAIILVLVFGVLASLAGWQWHNYTQSRQRLNAQLTVRELQNTILQLLPGHNRAKGIDSDELGGAFRRAQLPPESVIKMCDEGLAADPNVPWLYRLRGAMFREGGNLDRARQDLASADRLEEEMRKGGNEPSYDVKINVRLTPPPVVDSAEQQAIDVVTRLGGKVFRDRKLPGEPIVRVTLGESEVSEDDLKQVGSLTHVTSFSLLGTSITDEMLSLITSLFPALKELKLGDVGETDLAGLSGLQSLKSLDLAAADVNATRFRGLGRLNSLISLDLSFNAQFADAGMEDLAALSGLQRLDLSNTSVSDVGLAKLSPLAQLKSLNLADTKVSAQGVAELQKAIPSCTIRAK